MFRYNPSAKYEPNGGGYLQIMSGKVLCNQTIAVSSDDNFHMRFADIFVDYPFGKIRVGDKLWTDRNKAPLKGSSGRKKVKLKRKNVKNAKKWAITDLNPPNGSRDIPSQSQQCKAR